MKLFNVLSFAVILSEAKNLGMGGMDSRVKPENDIINIQEEYHV